MKIAIKKSMSFFLLCLFLTAPGATFAAAPTEIKTYQQAVRENPNDAEAHYNLGVAYANLGRYEEAIAEYKATLRINPNLAKAQFNLGVRYDSRRGVPQDNKQAMHWFRLAAEQGHAGAQFNLGVMYAKGRGVPQDDKQAAHWYRLAAEQGDTGAQFGLGGMYVSGRGVPQDHGLAYMWLNLAAMNGDKPGAAFRDIVAGIMTAAQIAKAKEMTRQWLADKKNK